MANNRLFLVDDATGDAIMLAKGWGGGWALWRENLGGVLEEWLNGRDLSGAHGGKTTLRIADESEPGLCHDGKRWWVERPLEERC